MKAIVVYESLWGNTAAIAKAIAEGLGPDARALSTAEATPAALAGAELIVAGAPVLGFSLPTEEIRRNIGSQPQLGAPAPPDLSKPSMRSWLERLPHGEAGFAAFETRAVITLGGATKGITEGLEKAGYHSIAKPQKFYVKGKYGPLKDGELERARQWGAELAKAAG
jgi:hypothetical protein